MKVRSILLSCTIVFMSYLSLVAQEGRSPLVAQPCDARAVQAAQPSSPWTTQANPFWYLSTQEAQQLSTEFAALHLASKAQLPRAWRWSVTGRVYNRDKSAFLDYRVGVVDQRKDLRSVQECVDLAQTILRTNYQAFLRLSDTELERAAAAITEATFANGELFVIEDAGTGEFIGSTLAEQPYFGGAFIREAFEQGRAEADERLRSAMERFFYRELGDKRSFEVYLTKVYVTADWQGRGMGLGKILFDAAKKRYPDAYFFYLGVYTGNPDAMRMWQRLGFNPFGTLFCRQNTETALYVCPALRAKL